MVKRKSVSLLSATPRIDSLGKRVLRGMCWTQAKVSRTDIEFITNIRAIKSRKMSWGSGAKRTKVLPRGLKKGDHKGSELVWEERVYLKEIYCLN